MDMPPSRYKVVEKGRRLVVIDRLTGEQVRHQIHDTPHRPDMPAMRMEAPHDGARPPAPRAGLAESGKVFTSQPWYDNRGPRTLTLSDNAFSALVLAGVILVALGLLAFVFLNFIAVFVVAFFLLQKGTRAALRRGATAWLDTLQQA